MLQMLHIFIEMTLENLKFFKQDDSTLNYHPELFAIVPN